MQLEFKIHPIFQCSMPKLFYKDSVTIAPIALISPLVILVTRWSQTIVPLREVFVQWTELKADDTSWKNGDNLKSAYYLEEKVIFLSCQE